MIKYKAVTNSFARKADVLNVFIDRQRIGSIEKAPESGYRYRPKSASNWVGDTFDTIAEVKVSIEGS